MILITGYSGTLTSELSKDITRSICCTDRRLLNLTWCPNKIKKSLKKFKPDIIIHCAALTRPMSEHDENPIKSIQTNIVATAAIAEYCIESECKLVYISTDYVYPGHYKDSDAPFDEESGLNPVNSYAWSKLGGECSVKLVPNHLIIRTAFTATPFPHEKAFDDMIKSYIYVDELATKIWKAIDCGLTGIYNIGGKSRTVLQYARETKPDIQKMSRLDVAEVTAIDCSMSSYKFTRDTRD